jgi:hypothetical protein
MLSVVLYGRNDSYGYNLHKRAALSLNCIAELLTHEQDEILFVDYNTPDDFPTFPEAIQDTLTARARSLLRILRVRPRHHQRFRDRTHLVALEPVARNVAVRRSNPANRWILSTNTDMIFVPRAGRSLSEIAEELPDGFYHLPRFEVPESLWESLDRMDPSGTIAKIGAWGRAFHLNEVVHAHDPWVKFDGPGDFQLILRSDLMRISGFHEGMLLGWHVDANIARRLHLLHGRTGDLLDDLFGYHCDHTRQVTPAHRPGSVQNDIVKFNDLVTQPTLPEQGEVWGLAGETIEALTAESTSASYVSGLQSVIAQEMTDLSHVTYAEPTYDHVTYDVSHALPFLTDIFASYPRDIQIGWYGSRCDLLTGFAEASRWMGFTEPVLVAAGATWLGETLPPGCVRTAARELERRADVFVFDCGLLSSDPAAPADDVHQASLFLARGFRRAVRAEEARLAEPDALPRRFIGVNAIHNRFESLIATHIGTARSPMASRIRQGFVMVSNQQAQQQDLFPLFAIGGAGERQEDRIIAVPGKAGHVIYGPYLSLDPGRYLLTLAFEPAGSSLAGDVGPLVLDVLADPYLIGLRSVGSAELAQGSVALAFTLTEELINLLPWLRVEFRLRTDGKAPISLVGATLEELAIGQAGEVDYDWLPSLSLAQAAEGGGGMTWLATAFRRRLLNRPGGAAVRGGIRARHGAVGHVVYGPYAVLPPGRYEAVFRLRVDGARAGHRAGRDAPVAVEVVSNDATYLAHRGIVPDAPGVSEYVLPFEVASGGETAGRVEFRVWSDGTLPFAIEGVLARHVDKPSVPARAEQIVAAA